jgi:hypothetical protein
MPNIQTERGAIASQPMVDGFGLMVAGDEIDR